jgi:hypothetical protein
MFITPSNVNANPKIFKCMTAGTTGTTEPAFLTGSYTSGTAVFTYVADMIDPISLPAKIPS